MDMIGVIIVSFNTRALLSECLTSLRACTLPLRVVVVDNGSQDGSSDLVRAQFPEMMLIEPGENLGFARANNLALRFVLGVGSQGPGVGEFAELTPGHRTPTPSYILLLNPDTVVQPGAIETMVGFLEHHPRVGMVGPRLLNPDGSLQHAAFRFPTLAMTALDLFPPGEVLPGRLYGSWWHGRYSQEHGDMPFAIDHPLGACMLVRREVVEQIGGMDEAFFMYAEEVDWCIRIRQASWAIFQVPTAKVIHVGGAATSQFRSRMLIALWESRMKLLRKYYASATVGWHQKIVRLGMLRFVLQSWRDWALGKLDRESLRARLWAFGRVFQL